MTAAAVFVALQLDWWPRFLALAELLGCAVEEITHRSRTGETGETVVYTGRSLAGDWVVS